MMRSPIPKKIRDYLSQDPFMKRCVFVGGVDSCMGRIEWHHAFSYAGKRQNPIWAIIPLCVLHHSMAAQLTQTINYFVVQRIHHFKAEEEFDKLFPKSTLLTT